jgi:hypothetical protein
VAGTAEGTVSTTVRLLELFDEDQLRIRRPGRPSGSALRVQDALTQRPLCTLQEAATPAKVREFPGFLLSPALLGIPEARGTESRNDSVYNLGIVFRELNESEVWLGRLVVDTSTCHQKWRFLPQTEGLRVASRIWTTPLVFPNLSRTFSPPWGGGFH